MVLTVPEVGVLSTPAPSILSVQVAPLSEYESPVKRVIFPDPTSVMIGRVVSILVTVARTDPVFPAPSMNSKVNDPLAEKVYVVEPELLVTEIGSLSPVRVTRTPVLVGDTVEYDTLAVGGMRSGASRTVMVRLTDVVFPTASVYSYVSTYDPV